MKRYQRGQVAIVGLALLLAISTLARAEIAQKGNVRVKVTGELSPRALPRSRVAPVSVSVDGQVRTVDGSLPPQLRVLKIEMNRNGRLDYRGLPVCKLREIQPANNQRALSACRDALVGHGTFSAYIVLKGLEPYAARGRLLVFNGRESGHQVLFGHIYIAQPFASSFVITFDIASHKHGTYGTTLTAHLAKSLGSRRLLTGIEMKLFRTYSYRGSRHSYLSAGCPAAKGFPGATFPLARTSFTFAGGAKLTPIVPGTCRVRR